MYRFLRTLDRWALKVFFREIEILGLENMPRDRPLLIVANHGNSLVDPMLLYGFLPVECRFLAKSTLWQHPVARFLVRLGRAIPVYRRQDPGFDPERNLGTFRRCHEALAEGGTIALFPEGISHDEPALMPLKTGVARIALEAEERFGPLDLRIVPVGLNFERRDMFRSRVLIAIGEPVDPLVGAPEPETDAEKRSQVRALTDKVTKALHEVTLNYDSWHDAEVLDRAAGVFSHPEAGNEAGRKLTAGDRFRLRRAFARGYEVLRKSHPERTASVFAATARYDEMLRRTGLQDAQVASDYRWPLVLVFTLKSLWNLTIWRPLALVGIILNWLPYRIPGWITQALRLPADQRATYKLLMGVVLLPTTWFGIAALAAWRWGWVAGIAALILAPLSGYFALLYGEWWRSFRTEARAYLRLKTRRRFAEELAADAARGAGASAGVGGGVRRLATIFPATVSGTRADSRYQPSVGLGSELGLAGLAERHAEGDSSDFSLRCPAIPNGLATLAGPGSSGHLKPRFS